MKHVLVSVLSIQIHIILHCGMVHSVLIDVLQLMGRAAVARAEEEDCGGDPKAGLLAVAKRGPMSKIAGINQERLLHPYHTFSKKG